MAAFLSLTELIGKTPLVQLSRMGRVNGNTILLKLEGHNPSGSVKARAALKMIEGAEQRGDLVPGGHLIEATSGNTGIALAMIAASRGYRLSLIMPDNLSVERQAAMSAYGAEFILVSAEEGMEGARDLALKMQREGVGVVLNQFGNPDNPQAHYETTGPEIWHDTKGQITHFVSAMGTTGTIMGVSRYLKEQNPDIQIVGVQPEEDTHIPVIRRWPLEYLPDIFEPERIDRIIDMSATDARDTARKLARVEGIFAGNSTGGALCAALRVSEQVHNAVIVSIACDRGDRYLSTDLFAD